MRLQAFLDHSGQTASDFARACAVSPSQITRLLRGERGASLDLALAIEKASQGVVTPKDLVPVTPETGR